MHLAGAKMQILIVLLGQQPGTHHVDKHAGHTTHPQIPPSRIHPNNQLNLLNPKPSSDPLLPIKRLPHVIKALEVNQPVNLVAPAKIRSRPRLVFPDTLVKVVGDANVKRLRVVSQNVDEAMPLARTHRSFASLKMTAFKLCAPQRNKSVRAEHRICDNSHPKLESGCHQRN